jgi:sialidase-1
MDVELLKQGFHVAYVDVAGMFGSPQAMDIGDQFYQFMTDERGLSKKPALEGVSRGGLFVYNWAARHPERVACIYCDTPVLDFKSWPAGKGQGLGSEAAWQQCLKAYQFTEQQALQFTGNPLGHAQIIAQHRIPLLHIVSENDVVVPPVENTYKMKQLLSDLNHDMAVISVPMGTEKSHGHHFTHPNPDQVVKFIRTHATTSQ